MQTNRFQLCLIARHQTRPSSKTGFLETDFLLDKLSLDAKSLDVFEGGLEACNVLLVHP